MSLRDEECELAHLMPQDDEGQSMSKAGEVTPPLTPSIARVPATPSSQTSNKVSSSGGGSIHGTGGTSQASLSSRNMSKLQVGSSHTPLPGSTSRLLYVNEKLGNLSRRPSLLSDSSCRTPKETKPSNMSRMASMKKEGSPVGVLVAPPNTPSPSARRGTAPSDTDTLTLAANLDSEASSLQTTKAVASEAEDSSECKTSTETLHRTETDRPHRPLGHITSNPGTLDFSASSANFGSTGGLNLSDHLTYLRANKSGHTGLRTVGSSAFIKSFWGKQKQKHLPHHCFISDITDVREMEQALLQLLEDFHSGKLRAFAKDCSMDQMQGIREQQERLARLHFDLGAQQELYAPLSEEGLRANHDNMHKLMGSLEQLSMSIEKLQLFSKDGS